jgi:antitoxin component YwqK of YwqJK toxin-antitoxin module
MKKLYLLIALMMLCFVGLQAQGKGNYYENGQKKAEGEFVGGKKSGPWKFYFDNGDVMREGSYKAGVPVGPWKEYYKGGQVKSEGAYISAGGEAVKQGTWITYHKNGSKEKEGKYANGKPVGTWYEYNTLGNQIGKVIVK